MNSILNFQAKYPSPPHLTQAQIDDHLIGDLAPTETAHLTGCADCTARATQAIAPIANFRAMATEWSERRSATLPLPAFAAQHPRWSRRVATGSAIAAILAIAVTVPVMRHQEHRQTAQMNSAAPSESQTKTVATAASISPAVIAAPAIKTLDAVNQQETISRDNRMLQAINSELDASVENSSTLGLEPVSEEQSQPPLAAPLQD
jgi:hypothetical protein